MARKGTLAVSAGPLAEALEASKAAAKEAKTNPLAKIAERQDMMKRTVGRSLVEKEAKEENPRRAKAKEKEMANETFALGSMLKTKLTKNNKKEKIFAALSE